MQLDCGFHLEFTGFEKSLMNESSDTGGTNSALYFENVLDVFRKQMCLAYEADIVFRNEHVKPKTPNSELTNQQLIRCSLSNLYHCKNIYEQTS